MRENTGPGSTGWKPRTFVCSVCGQVHRPGESEYTCVACYTGVLEPTALSAATIEAPVFTPSPGMWRYEHLLALSPHAPRPPLPVGGTPLVPAGRLAEQLGLPNLWIKNDALNPTGSLKDRASAVSLARAAEIGAAGIAVASTGNAGSSLAGLAASMGMPAVIFVPESAPRAKLIQSLLYGARVFAVRGTYDDAFDLCLEACTHFNWYNRSTALNHWTIEGKKTVAFEIYEQFGNRAPDLVLIPTGDGCILSGVARGFHDLLDLGLIDRLPRLIAVQAAGSNAIARLLTGDPPLERAHTVADSIKVRVPRNGKLAVRDIRACGGRAIVVLDEAILTAVSDLAATTGIFAEPAAAASLAGLRALLQEEPIDADATVVLMVTGNGLKDVDSAAATAPAPTVIEPSLEAVQRYLRVSPAG
jgi:threonine synthase